MNLIFTLNDNLPSIKNSSEGKQKREAAVKDAVERVSEIIEANKARVAAGKKPIPVEVEVKDEYGKTVVSMREAQSLEEKREEFLKWKGSAEMSEERLLAAIDEVGNGGKDSAELKKELERELSKSLFIAKADLSPGLAQFLRYCWDPMVSNEVAALLEKGPEGNGLKREITESCIKQIIDLPNPKTGKPPKTFAELMANLKNISDILAKNPMREKCMETARLYVKNRYLFIVPESARKFFSERGGLEECLKSSNPAAQSEKFSVTVKNFREVYKFLYDQAQGAFDAKAGEALKLCMKFVAPEDRKAVQAFVAERTKGCKRPEDFAKALLPDERKARKEEKGREGR